MKHFSAFVLGVVSAFLASPEAAAQSAIDPTATVVELRTSCLLPGGAYLDNCFETTADLTAWLWGEPPLPPGRASPPGALDPVTVRVGPGDFDRLRCSGPNGWTSFLGSGREHSRFVNDSILPDPNLVGGVACPGGITSDGCTGLHFQNLSAHGKGTGVYWAGAGLSTWDAVDIVGDDDGALGCSLFPYVLGWYDVQGAHPATHYFWDARFVARGSTGFVIAYYSHEVETWIYASDVLAQTTGPTNFVAAAVNANSRADVRIFGSTVRATASPSTTGIVHGLYASAGTIHMHGGIVNVTALGDQSSPSVSIASIGVVGNAFVHTPGTGFVLKGHAAANRIRIQDLGGVVESPFLWPPSVDAPDITSTDGSDMFIKTDGGPSGTESVLYLLDNDCPAPHWRSAADGTCL